MRKSPPPPPLMPLPPPPCSSSSRLAAVSSLSSSRHTTNDDDCSFSQLLWHAGIGYVDVGLSKKRSSNGHNASELATAADEAQRVRQPESTSVRPLTNAPGAHHVRPSHHSNGEKRDTSQVIEDITGRNSSPHHSDDDCSNNAIPQTLGQSGIGVKESGKEDGGKDNANPLLLNKRPVKLINAATKAWNHWDGDTEAKQKRDYVPATVSRYDYVAGYDEKKKKALADGGRPQQQKTTEVKVSAAHTQGEVDQRVRGDSSSSKNYVPEVTMDVNRPSSHIAFPNSERDLIPKLKLDSTQRSREHSSTFSAPTHALPSVPILHQPPGAYHIRPTPEIESSNCSEDIVRTGDTERREDDEEVGEDEEPRLVLDATVVSSSRTFTSEEGGGGYVGPDNLPAMAEAPPVLATETKDTFCGYLERTPRARRRLVGAVLLIFAVLLGIGLGVGLSSSHHPPSERTDKVKDDNDFWVNLQVPPNVDGQVERGEFGATVSMNQDGTRMAVGSPDVMEDDGKGDDGLVRRGVVTVYDLTDAGTWEQVGQEIQILARDAASHVFIAPYEVRNELALALSRNGNMLAVGSPIHDTSNKTDIGQVEVFSLNGETWEPAGDPLNGDEQEGDFFGASVSLSEDGGILAVGAPGSDSDNGEGQKFGAVKAYLFNRGTWNRLGERDIVGMTPNQLLGGSVSLSSDGLSVAVGSSKTSNNKVMRVAGVYRFQVGDWIEVGSGVDGGVGLFDTAYDVAISADGDRFVISNHYIMKQTEDDDPNNIGTEDNIDLFVQAFQLEFGDWIPLGDNVHAMTPGELSGYFISLSDDGNIIAMGDPGRRVEGGRNTGHSHIYRFDEETGNYEQVGPDNDGEGAGDLSGFAVSISGDGNRFAVGSPANRGNGFEHGRVQVFMVPDLH